MVWPLVCVSSLQPAVLCAVHVHVPAPPSCWQLNDVCSLRSVWITVRPVAGSTKQCGASPVAKKESSPIWVPFACREGKRVVTRPSRNWPPLVPYVQEVFSNTSV